MLFQHQIVVERYDWSHSIVVRAHFSNMNLISEIRVGHMLKIPQFFDDALYIYKKKLM